MEEDVWVETFPRRWMRQSLSVLIWWESCAAVHGKGKESQGMRAFQLVLNRTDSMFTGQCVLFPGLEYCEDF